MFPKLKWMLLAAAILLGLVILWPRPSGGKGSPQSGESNVAAAPASSLPSDSLVRAKPVKVSSSEPVRPAAFAPAPGAVASAATNNTAGSFIPIAEASRPEELKPGSYEPEPKAKLVDWEILPPDPARPNVLTRARLLDVTGGAASAATSAAEAARISAAQGIKYPFARVEEELVLNAQGKVVSSRVTREMVADEIIVKFPEGTRMTAAAEIAAQLGGVAAEKPFAPMTWLIAVPVSLRAVPSAVEDSKSATPYAEYSEPNLLVRPVATPNDTRYNDLWHLNNTVELNRDIRAESAWDSDTNADGVIVAVIDTGVRYTHEDLAANMWVNPGETAANGIDDDSNGYVDDVYGADEYSNDGNPADGGGHGTMVSGYAGAVGNNGKGVTGVAWTGIKIMALRFIDQTGSTADNVACIDYAINKGAKVINASYGSAGSSLTESSAIQRAANAGIIMVAAAGNGGGDGVGDNNDTTPFYPASYTRSNIIAVGATDRTDAKASFSNFGATSVDLFAPGVNVWSTSYTSDTSYASGSGTSYAAPIVSGALALLRSSYPNDSVSQLVTRMLAGVTSVAGLSGQSVTGGRLNLSLIVPTTAPAVLPTAWHRPAYTEGLISTTMRTPAYEVATGSPFTVYSGVRKFNNPGYGTANQTGGTIIYRAGTNGAWSSNALAWHSNNGDYQFWSNSVPGTATTNTVQYYLRLTFDSGVARTNYIYGNDNSSWVTTDEAAAQAQPFSLRDRPSWVYHGNNRSVNGNNVTFTTLVGYAANDASNNLVYQGANFGALYYTTNGATPVGSQGNAGNADTFVVYFTYQGLQQDNSAAGEAMVWTALVTNMPTFQNINYRIGFWNSANGEEQWAGYNTTNTNPVTVFTIGTVGAPQLTISTPSNGSLNADYTTTKLYVDEIAGDSIPVTVTFAPNTSNITAVELFSNLNNRDRAESDANSDGIPDGIVPPDGNAVSVTNTNTYYQAYTMTNSGGANYTATINATKTGAYRLTARYKTSASTNWVWYSSGGRRDHAITVAPVQARDIRMYELNIFNMEASGKTFATRSTIEDLTDETNAVHTSSNRVNNFNLGYLQNLGVNWIWFQPYHPYGWEGRHESAANINARDASAGANTKVWNGSSYYDDVNYAYELGSPYAKKNFWEVEPRMSAAFSGSPTVQTNVSSPANRATAMAAFQNFMAKADAAGVNLMPDAAFNHSAWDIELGQAGVDYIMSAVGASGWNASDLIHDREVRVFSRKNDYAQRATYYNTFFDNNIAPAPDRGDFGKWLDVVDIFFGRYSALVSQNPSDNNNRLNETDSFDYSVSPGNFDAITRGVWRYFARYAPYWLEKGRPAGQARNSTVSDGDAAARYAWDARGIDGLRCDFGQGLPPQAWEYIINVARSKKWSFVFMSESLDGGAITYRSNRHFDILNENIVFPGKAASATSNYREMFEGRRGAYGQGLVLLNTVSHDEDNYQDPWQAFIRYAVYGTLDGAPMIFPGQELGISNLYGYDLYEINFGKPVPHFKTYNSMMIAWGNDDYALNQLQPAYSAINAARGFSKALRSNNRYFINQTSGGVHESIFSVAKYETLNGSPASNDVVFGFVNLNRDAGQSGTFNVAQDVDSNGVNDYGIKSGRKYNVKNIAAHLAQTAGRRDTFLWGAGLTGGNILSNGIYVGMNAIPGSSSGAWTAAPYEAFYLKLYDTTAPGAVSGSVTNNLANGSYAITNQATFTWAAVAADSEGIVPSYKVNISTNGVLATNAIVTSNSYTYTAPAADTKVDVTVQAVNPNDTTSASAATAVNTSYLLTAGGDYNNNGTSNATDISNGSNPTVNSTPAAVYINEVQSTNTGLPDQHGQLLDWVELYNPGGSSFDLSGYYLSDSLSNKIKYQFPNGTSIPAGGYLLVWCGNSTDGPVTSPYNAGQIRTTAFAISSGGEPIVLTATDGTTIIDQFVSLAIGTSGTPAVGRSLGRGTGVSFDTLYFYTSPTQGAVNNTSGTEAIPLAAPIVNVGAGIYTNSQSVTVTTTETNGVIRYTLDGSDPTESSPIYSNAITLTNPAPTTNSGMAYVPSNNLDQSDEDAWRTPSEAPARINVLRAKVFKTGKAPSRTTTRSYVINPLGTNRYQFPIVSLATTPGNITNNSNGIYVYGTNTYQTNWTPDGTNGAVPQEFWANYFQSGSAWERSGNVEFFERNGATLLAGEMGLRINGNTTRLRPRKALRIYNRNSSGSAVWSAQLFPDKNVTNHERFILRASGNDWARSLFRDAYMSDLGAGLTLDRQHTRPVVVFLSGEYWGIHNLRDRLDESWMFHHYGLGETDYAFLEVTDGAADFLNELSDSSAPIYDHGNTNLLADYKDILTRAGNNEFASAAGYTNLNTRIDLENYIDYMAVTIFGGNTDWPGNNMQMWRSLTNASDPVRPKVDGRWRYVIKDNDFALGMDLPYVPGYSADAAEMAQFDVLAHASSSISNSFANNEIATRLFRKVLDNPVFRTNFVNRYADLLNSTLSTNNTLGLLQRYADTYGPGVEEHFKRWPVAGQSPTNYWTNIALARVRTYLTARTEAVRSHVQNKFGLGTASLTVNVNNTNGGTITVNRLNINPATPGLPDTNTPYPWTGTYFQEVAVPVTAVPNSGYRFVSWTLSGNTNAASSVVASDSTANYSGWTNGANPGTGFGAWTFSDTAAGSDGFFIGSSSRRIHNASPDQQSFGIFAHTDSGGSPNASARATRPFSAALGINQTFSVKISPGGFARSSHKGVEFGTAATNWFEFFASDFDFAPAYFFRNGGTTTRIDSGSFWANADYTFDLSVTRTASNSYTVTIARGSQSFTTNLTSATPVDRASFYSYGNPNGDDTNNLFFNLPKISQPSAVDTNSTASTNSTVSLTLASSRTLTATFESLAASGLAVQLPAVGAAGMPLSGLQVRATNSAGDTDGAFTNSVVLTVAGTNGVTLYYTNSAVAGVAAFANVNLPSGATYGFSASSGALVSGAATNLAVGDGALYLPTNNNVWNTATNWDVGAVPNSTTARAIVPANAATNRTITNDTSVTLASLTFSNGSTAFANTIAGPAGNSLTFQAVNTNAVISVTGSGTGNAELNLTGPVVLNSDLVVDVQSTNSANQEYGAMRLRGTNWSGAGGVIKRGPGMAGFTQAGKAISGNILVEQGVLTFSEPSISSLLSTNITVQSGGQLRLSSAFTTTNVPRTNNIKGVLNLAGSGRTGVGTNENLGVLGALRLETGTTGTTSLLTNTVNLTASADIHVPAGNTIQLNGPLTASSNNVILTKSGGGTLTLGTNAGGFIGGITVNRGALRISAATFTNTTNPIILTNETTLVGSGQWGGALQAGAGSAMTFELGAAPAGTALLRAASATFAGSNAVTVTVPTNAVPGTYPLFSVTGSISGFSNVSLASSVTNFAWSQLILSNNTIFALLATNPPSLPTAWHNPAATESLLSPPGSMRSPAYDLSGGTHLAIYAAFRRLNNPVYGTAELSAGQLYYRAATNAAWSSAALVFHANNGDHQIWKADLPAGSVSASTEYYIRLAFESGVASPVYVHDNSANNTSAVTVTEATAQAQPFALRKATTTLGDLVQAFNGAARSATATTAPTNLTVNLTYNGSATAPTNPGLYTVIGTISDATFQGVVTNSFVITGVLPSNDSVIRPTNGKPVQIAFGTLLANDARVASNGSVLTNSGLSIVSVSSAALTNVWLTNGTHVYFRALTNTPEFFTYSVTDGTSTNTATVTVAPTNYVAPPFTLQVVGIGTAVFDGTNTRMTNDFIGVPGQFYAIEYKGEMSDPSWSSAGSINSGASGSFSVPFIKSGNSAVDWNGSMFFRGYRTNQ